ncbi:MAG: hypothetical protein WBG32_16310, partial [Nodosilinea sp.]
TLPNFPMEVNGMNPRSAKAAEEFQAALQEVEQLFDSASETPDLAPGDLLSTLDDGGQDAHSSIAISDQDEPI